MSFCVFCVGFWRLGVGLFFLSFEVEIVVFVCVVIKVSNVALMALVR